MVILIPRAVLLFDIDGVIRDVGGSYRRAIVETVHHYSGWRPDPAVIDALKAEGCWNNDWEASLELLRRYRGTATDAAQFGDPQSGDPSTRSAGLESSARSAGTPFPARTVATPGATSPLFSPSPLPVPSPLPSLAELVEVFGGFYFGGNPDGDPSFWRGFIGSEPLLVEPSFFTELNAAGIAWGFVSGAEPPSVRYVLEQRLGLLDPPRIAMGDAPDKPDPTGFLRLAERLLAEGGGSGLGAAAPPVAYLGDTVADVLTVERARQVCPEQRFLSLAVAPPHLQGREQLEARHAYEQRLRQAGADRILPATVAVLANLEALLRQA
ncbi:TIGR01548 family HAD-type hydrolase [Vulcanococcus limneticus]|uniref:TIGR01548 family HAD-type hydrolase n=1 Tax=Vulcanococcus limneticus TaxID=2170428 RepID=UPI00398BC0F0